MALTCSRVFSGSSFQSMGPEADCWINNNQAFKTIVHPIQVGAVEQNKIATRMANAIPLILLKQIGSRRKWSAAKDAEISTITFGVMSAGFQEINLSVFRKARKLCRFALAAGCLY